MKGRLGDADDNEYEELPDNINLKPFNLSEESSLSSRDDSLNSDEDMRRMANYLQLCETGSSSASRRRAANEPISAPVFSWEVRQILQRQGFIDRQHALLGSSIDDSDTEPLLLNTEHPWSAFICGSQGSGKSYTTSCILEGCLSQNDKIGSLQQPMAGMVFHYDRYGANICEVATLSTGKAPANVEILVSPSNFKTMERLYSSINNAKDKLKIKPLYLKSCHLNAERIQKFMACEEGTKPLYMSAVDRVLRDMGIENQGPHVKKNGKVFSYRQFKDNLKKEKFTDAQREPLNLRLSLLESYMAPDRSAPYSILKKFLPDEMVDDSLIGEAGCLKLVDLTDPHLDRAGACALFDLCLAVFIQSTKGPKVIALDEAHNYIGQSTTSAEFTEDLLKVVREQRHNGSRIIIATQEPTISTQFLDLCTMTIVHRFTSPGWFRTLRGHLGGASPESGMNDEKSGKLFEEIGGLEVGESFLFSPTSQVDVKDGVVEKLEFRRKKMKTRLRITDDLGKSKLAQDN